MEHSLSAQRNGRGRPGLDLGNRTKALTIRVARVVIHSMTGVVGSMAHAVADGDVSMRVCINRTCYSTMAGETARCL